MLTKFMATTALILAMGTPGWAATASGNLQVFNDVQKQVLQYSQFTIFDTVSAQIDNGVVTLTGKVTMPYKRTDLEKRVAKVDGVQQVQNHIEVLPTSSFDDELRFRIARAIYRNSNFWGYGSMVNPPIHVIVEHGHVTLEGVVNNNMDRMLARSIASSFGTFGPIVNNLRTDAEAKAELEKI